MFRGLAADQDTARLAAAVGDAADHLFGDTDVELAADEIIEKKNRLRGLSEHVVDPHRDEIDADRIVNARHKRDPEFCPDAVGRGNKHRIAILESLEVEQAAESSDARE